MQSTKKMCATHLPHLYMINTKQQPPAILRLFLTHLDATVEEAGRLALDLLRGLVWGSMSISGRSHESSISGRSHESRTSTSSPSAREARSCLKRAALALWLVCVYACM